MPKRRRGDPRAKAASHSSRQSEGSARASRNPSGRAPLAARSERFTRNALRAIAPGGSSAKKWTPATSASVVRTRSSPAGGRISAASSRRPNPAGPASGAKYRAIRSASPRRGGMERANPKWRANRLAADAGLLAHLSGRCRLGPEAEGSELGQGRRFDLGPPFSWPIVTGRKRHTR